MSSKSTSIGDLPNVSSGENSDIDQETMMVNSILQEIENDDDIDTSENAINYAIDTSQIPPQIHEQLPTKQIIEETAKEIFNLNIPILGICYGLQLIVKQLKGNVKTNLKKREFGRAVLIKKKKFTVN